MTTNSVLNTARLYGRGWARTVAETGRAGPLERLEAFAKPSPPLSGPFDGLPMAPWGHADHLAAAALGGPPSEEVSTRFWEREVRLPATLWAALDDTEFLTAFLDAVLEV